MSIKLMTMVWDLALPAKEKLILLALADNANEIGGQCWPSIATISRKTSVPERTVQRVIRALVEHGAIESRHDFRTRKTVYTVTFPGMPLAVAPDYRNCPAWLRREIIIAFQSVCEYCGGKGDEVSGPDGKPWEVDRIVPGSRGGSYAPENVTLSCKSCNCKKNSKAAPGSTRHLAAVEGAKTAPSFLREGANPGETMVPNEAADGAIVGGDIRKNRKESSLEPSTPTLFADDSSKKIIERTVENLWRLYPVKKGKPGGTAAMRRALHRLVAEKEAGTPLSFTEAVAVLEVGIAGYKAEIERDNIEKKFWKWPQGFFNDSRYLMYWEPKPLPVSSETDDDLLAKVRAQKGGRT